MKIISIWFMALVLGGSYGLRGADDFPKPFSSPCTQRQEIFAFSSNPAVTNLGNDRYAIDFMVKGYCDVTVAVSDRKGIIVRHVASGVLGSNAPKAFQKNSLKQRVFWDGKDDFGAYCKDINSLQIKVSLGLNPTFDKRLGPTHPKNMPGGVWGLAADASGVYAMTIGRHGRVFIRKFSSSAKYLKTLSPPPANLSNENLEGMGTIEYEANKRALQGPDITDTVAQQGNYLARIDRLPIDIQPIIVEEKIYYVNAPRSTRLGSKIYYLGIDGSTDLVGQGGWKWGMNLNKKGQFRMAASPDGKWCYLVGNGQALYRRSLVENKPVEVWIGDARTSGSDQKHFNAPMGVDVDADGMVYVADQYNNRIQIFSAEGKYLQTIPVMKPSLIRVHQKTGALYVIHQTRIKGKAVGRLSTFVSRKDPTVRCTQDGVYPVALVVDSWSDTPRVWMGGSSSARHFKFLEAMSDWSSSFTIWEEDGKGFKKVGDFVKEAHEAEPDVVGFKWNGAFGKINKVVCDPARNQVYYKTEHRFDLSTGNYLGTVKFKADDIAFDKKGFVHCHFNPGFYIQGSGRLDPSRTSPWRNRQGKLIEGGLIYTEVPYNYGVSKAGPHGKPWIGILPTKCQPGAKFFQDGIGVNMRGDIAVQSNIYHIPKMSELSLNLATEALQAKRKLGIYVDKSAGGDFSSYSRYMQSVKEKEKRGETVYFVRRKPGIPLGGATLWTFDNTGELRQECAVVAGDLINGVQIDEDGDLYFVNARPKMFANERYFLQQKGWIQGQSRKRMHPFTGSLIKTAGQGSRFLMASAVVPLETLPQRPPDLINIQWPGIGKKNQWCWVEGAKWIYAGASPIVPNACSCPTMRHSTDWFKRSFVPEAYRHSIGVLDSAGNLIMHIGRYGNWDSGMGAKSLIDVGGDHIGITFNEMVSATDKYLAFDDHGEKLVVLKLEYHVEKSVSIK